MGAVALRASGTAGTFPLARKSHPEMEMHQEKAYHAHTN